ncbi:hypothetical protein GCM10009682_28220 [Luedemannella flava]|uniref:Uncharacterized protein n=1 Tax=Luedemannella flava TaxID=349316 RepID=A0ABN2M045_9ACTN
MVGRAPLTQRTGERDRPGRLPRIGERHTDRDINGFRHKGLLRFMASRGPTQTTVPAAGATPLRVDGVVGHPHKWSNR